MTYEMSELIELGEAGTTIQAEKRGGIDEVSGVLGPNSDALEEE